MTGTPLTGGISFFKVWMGHHVCITVMEAGMGELGVSEHAGDPDSVVNTGHCLHQMEKLFLNSQVWRIIPSLQTPEKTWVRLKA